MDYDLIFDEIGHFGRWQQLNCFLSSLCLIGASFMMFMFTFIGFIPKFRCLIPECEGNLSDPEYNANFTQFMIPEIEDEDDIDGQHQCKQYIFKNVSYNFVHMDYRNIDLGQCLKQNVNQNITKVCHQHVYDTSQYKYPLTAELDLSPCESSSEYWNLEASIIIFFNKFFLIIY